jgi:hypothetical protein
MWGGSLNNLAKQVGANLAAMLPFALCIGVIVIYPTVVIINDKLKSIQFALFQNLTNLCKNFLMLVLPYL